MQSSATMADFARGIFDAMIRGDAEHVITRVSTHPGSLWIATDPKEWWQGVNTFGPAFRAQTQEMGGSWPLRIGDIQAFESGDVGWFGARIYVPTPDGGEALVRVTGIAERENGEFRIVQTHASIGVANEEAVGRELTT